MAGIVAIIALDRNRSVTETEIADFAAAYETLRGPGTRHHAAADYYARVINITDADHPGIETVNSSWVVSHGVAHFHGPLLGAPLDQLDGQFCLISYEASTREVIVAVDPFGLQPLYLAERAGKVYISTSVLALAKYLHAKPSLFGFSMFLRAGYHFGSRTNWEGIERLEPGTCISYTKTGQKRCTYWRPVIDEEVARLGLAQAVDYCLEVAIETCRAHLAGKPRSWVDLTGGYDCRLLSLMLCEAGVDFCTCTRGDEDDEDVRIARQMASLCSWDWVNIAIPHDLNQYMLDLIPLALAWGDAHLEILQLAQALWQYSQLACTTRSLLGGGGGELLRNFAWQQEFLKVGKSNRVNYDNWIDMRLLHPMRTSIFAQDPTAEVREDFRNRMEAWAEPYQSQLNTVQLSIMYAYKGTGHVGLHGPAFGAFVSRQLPFFFKPIFTAAISTNWRYRNGHALMRHMIERLSPRVAAIPTTWGGPAEPIRVQNMHRFLPYYADIGRRAANKLSEKAFGRGWFARPEAVDSRTVAARRALLEYVSGDKTMPPKYSNMRSAPLFNPKQLDEFLLQALEPCFPDTALFGRVLTVELALRATDSTLEG
jgi:hypothetical protein